jgi:hypothetical protein
MFNTMQESRERENELVAALATIHRRQRPLTGDPNPYARIVDHFDRRGQRLRGEQLVTSQMVARLFKAATSLPPEIQQEILLDLGENAVAVGRFRVSNRTEASAEVEFLVGDPEPAATKVEVSFAPGRPEIAAGGSVVVRIQVRVTGSRPADALVIPVECRSRGARDRLWVVVTPAMPVVQDRAR